MQSLPTLREMHRAFYASNSAYDGLLYVAVKTTGIFCVPSCTARKPLKNNIEFYATPRDAIFAGYRPCKRCRPLAVNGHPEWVEQILKLVEDAPEERMRDAEIRNIGVDPARARRYFKKQYGMTFQAYSRGRRLGKALQQIRAGASVDDAVFSNGYESQSGFRDAFGKTFGTPPGKSHETRCILTSLVETPLGPIIVGATDEGICLVEFCDRRMLEFQIAKLRQYFRCPILPGINAHLTHVKRELAEYFEGRLKKFTVSMVVPGSEFQQNVWRHLQKIPYGKTISYETLAGQVGIPKASRAVGTANGMNRIAIVIPCHRVVNKSGELGGYGGGLWRKQWMIDMERGRRTAIGEQSS